jgi:hypothetical protein
MCQGGLFHLANANEIKTMNSSESFAVFECKRCNEFSTDASLASAEQHQQMKEHLDAAHAYWEFENLGSGLQDYKSNFRPVNRIGKDHFCIVCRTLITRNTLMCPSCGTDTTEFIESPKEHELNRAGNDRKQLLGVIGSIMVFFGVFTPIISVPIVGSMNYFQNGKGDGVIVLVLALISIGLVLAKKYGGLWITGGGSLAVMLFTFLNFQLRMSQMHDEMEIKLAGNPFRGIADVAMQSIQIQWGWAVLVIGAALLIAAAAIKR